MTLKTNLNGEKMEELYFRLRVTEYDLNRAIENEDLSIQLRNKFKSLYLEILAANTDLLSEINQRLIKP